MDSSEYAASVIMDILRNLDLLITHREMELAALRKVRELFVAKQEIPRPEFVLPAAGNPAESEMKPRVYRSQSYRRVQLARLLAERGPLKAVEIGGELGISGARFHQIVDLCPYFAKGDSGYAAPWDLTDKGREWLAEQEKGGSHESRGGSVGYRQGYEVTGERIAAIE